MELLVMVGAIIVMTDWFSQHNQNHCCHCNWFYCCYLIHFGSFLFISSYFILFYNKFSVIFPYTFLTFPFFLSSRADHALRGRDEWRHWPSWDNPVALHSRWLEGIKSSIHPKKLRGHTHTPPWRWLTSHCLRNIIFSVYPKKHTQTHTLMIVLCVSSCGWRLLLVLWCPRALGTKTLMLGLFSLHYHPPGFTVVASVRTYSNKISRGGAFHVERWSKSIQNPFFDLKRSSSSQQMNHRAVGVATLHSPIHPGQF